MDNNTKFYFPVHLDGGNRGCEGIAKGTAQLMSVSKEHLLGLCSDVDLDKKLGIDEYITLLKKPGASLLFRLVNKLYVTFISLFKKDDYLLAKLSYYHSFKPFFEGMRKGDIMFSTGGDMMCYGDNEVIYTNEIAKKKGAKTVLWGCSMGKENLTTRKEATLRQFDVIYARESLSYEFFKSMGLNNVVCYPDPAFALLPEKITLPNCFDKGKVIGINLSNYTVGAFNLNTPFGEEVRILLSHIFSNPNYQVLLIPHVLWPQQDDRLIALEVKKEYAEYEDRITILKSERMNYQQIRFIISKCHSFIGGRTHAVISAYSTCVPTIALGYSIKSRGIAKDLGLSEQLVVNTKMVAKKEDLLNSFMYLEENYLQLQEHLENVIPSYIAKTNNVKEIIC